jgi:hypothetical protein
MMENTFLKEFDWFRIYTVGLRVLHCPKDFLDTLYFHVNRIYLHHFDKHW